MITEFRLKPFSLLHGSGSPKISTDPILLGAWVDLSDALSIADIGAGCGIIGLMLAHRSPLAHVSLIESNPLAAHLLNLNVQSSPYRSRLQVLISDFLLVSSQFDLIVSNPPFFLSGEQSPSPLRAAARHCSNLSPLSLVHYAAEHLSPRGSLALICPAEYENQLIETATFERLNLQRICRVCSKIGAKPFRIMVQFSRIDRPIAYSSLALRDATGNPTEDYKQLTHDFYLQF